MFSCTHCSCTIFILISLFGHKGHANFDFNWCSVFTQKGAFSFEKCLNCQNPSSSGSNHPLTKSLQSHHKFFSPHWGGIYPPPPIPYLYFENPDFTNLSFSMGKIWTPSRVQISKTKSICKNFGV